MWKLLHKAQERHPFNTIPTTVENVAFFNADSHRTDPPGTLHSHRWRDRAGVNEILIENALYVRLHCTSHLITTDIHLAPVQRSPPRMNGPLELRLVPSTDSQLCYSHLVEQGMVDQIPRSSPLVISYVYLLDPTDGGKRCERRSYRNTRANTLNPRPLVPSSPIFLDKRPVVVLLTRVIWT